MTTANRIFFNIALAGLMAGCSMIPSLDTPPVITAKQWPIVEGYEWPTGQGVASTMTWRSFYTDSAFQTLIQTALDNNRDLRQAALDIDAARALYRVSRADIMPDVNAAGNASYQGSSDDSSTTGRGTTSDMYRADVGISSYEIDLFGKIRSRNTAALNDYLATAEGAQLVRNTLIAEVASAYLQLLADRKLLSLTEQTLEAQKKTYDILNQSLKQGVATDQDVARAQTAVETALVNLHQYQRFVAQDMNALHLLLGVDAATFTLPETRLDQVEFNDSLAVETPSEVLLVRPDIRQAEYTLLARNADIGAARAAFFPSISLTGAYGFASDDLGGLFSSGALGAWSFVPGITLPIFTGGRNSANLDLAEIRKEQAIVAYEQAIQTAFREVADVLAMRATIGQQLAAQRRLVKAAERVYNISQSRYRSGIDNFLSVLDAQRALYAAQQGEIETQRQNYAAMIDFFKALGGGTMQENNP